mmetsp:Transcript_12694/g.27557  ORF Transcript_12694/g.27557 Transcript_12694/m.27557 type:complete len:109 (-) Transcript_12694:185-511(-)
MTQRERDYSLKQFKSGRNNILIATDVAARGLDIPLVSHVINFDYPKFIDDYYHRIGRTGRAGMTGEAISFISKRDTSKCLFKVLSEAHNNPAGNQVDPEIIQTFGIRS